RADGLVRPQVKSPAHRVSITVSKERLDVRVVAERFTGSLLRHCPDLHANRLTTSLAPCVASARDRSRVSARESVRLVGSVNVFRSIWSRRATSIQERR